ncbi:Zinc finger, RING/FYVE/PHD-type [Phytophthora cinnamomi]|nr:Zinc finger, RING/FYVE/PHD-type [Phytophthora cinnamomi]
MHGSLEDVLYGIHAKTREEMQLTVPHVSKGYLDCTMLAKLEGGSPLDPYRQLSLKWHLTEAIGDAKLSHLRDLCVLEFMGISTDSQGERYAYHLIKSVEFGGCPAPPEGCGVIRANIMFCSIYRQAPGSSVVRVYAKGMFDLGGDTPSFLTNNTSCSLMLTIPRAVESSEAKRLTLLAVRKAASSVSSSCEDLPTDDDLDEFDLSVDSVDLSADEMSSGYSNSAHSISAEVVSVSAPPTLFRLLSKGKSKKRQQAGGVCCVCAKQPAMAAIVVTSHRSCGVCHRGVCSKCRVKRQLYARSQPVPVTCCKSCLVEAKQLAVDPQNPCPMLL